MNRRIRLIWGLSVWGACCWFTGGVALGLPQDRSYELVSPTFKSGYAASKVAAVSPNGDTVAFQSSGVFSGALANHIINAYVAHREASGWATEPLVVPAAIAAYSPSGAVPADFSEDLGLSIFYAKPGPNYSSAFYAGKEVAFLSHGINIAGTLAGWQVLGSLLAINEKPFTVRYEGGSGDLCHIIFEGQEPLLGEAAKTASHLYDFERGCGGEPASLRVVGLNNNPSEPKVVNPACAPTLGDLRGTVNQGKSFNAVAEEGQEVLFSTCVGGAQNPRQLFVRLAGSKTLEVSKPISEECADASETPKVPCTGAPERQGAEFVGADEAGTHVFFMTEAPLVAEDKDQANDLYAAEIGCPAGEGEGCDVAHRQVLSLTQVSHDANSGEAAEVQGVVKVAPDALHVYFVARGVLSEGSNAENQTAVRGADNLYIYDRVARKVSFVADLCSGQGVSGRSEDLSCPASLDEEGAGNRNDKELWSSEAAQTAGENGRFLVFSTYAQLASTDTDSFSDVYRYDAMTGVLERVSLGEAGSDANGNDSACAPLGSCDVKITPTSEVGVVGEKNLDSRAVSEDGSRIVFTTASRLSPAATNGVANAYEWHAGVGIDEGSVSLISTGNDEEPVTGVVMSAAGTDVLFTSTQSLVPQDSDGVYDVYDARLNGGFPPSAAPREPCAGDGCQGPLTNPTPLLITGSVSQAPGENLTSSQSKTAVKTKPKPKKKFRASKRRTKASKTRGKVGAKNSRVSHPSTYPGDRSGRGWR